MANNDTKNQEEPLEKQLWKAADKLRKNIDAAEYKHIVLGLIFLKYISDAFEGMYDKLKKGEGEYAGADPEDRDEYKAENIFFVPPEARWSYLQGRARQPEIGKDVDNAMDAIEKENPSLKGVLPKVFARGNQDPASLGGLIDLVGNIALGDAKARSADVLGHVFAIGEELAHDQAGFLHFLPFAQEVVEVSLVVHHHDFSDKRGVVPELSGEVLHILRNLWIDFVGHGRGSHDSFLPGFADLAYLRCHKKIDLLTDPT